MKEKEIYWVNNPSFMVGKKYKVLIKEPVSMQLCTTLKAFADLISDDSSTDEDSVSRFVHHCAIDLLLPLQVFVCVHFFKD